MLKQRRRKKQEKEQEMQQANIKLKLKLMQNLLKKQRWQKYKKNQALNETNIQFEQAKSQFEIQRMQTANQLEKEIMAERFGYDMQLKQMEVKSKTQKEAEIENRKDERVRIVGTQQSKMIDQRNNGLLPTDFESNSMENTGGAKQPMEPPAGMATEEVEVVSE